MSEPRVQLSDFNTTGSVLLPGQEGYQWFREFGDEQEETGEPLLGPPDETVLERGGMLLMYGDGGAGKSTLTLDAAVHLASATPWLGIPIPQPTRIFIIENEGSRGKYRQRCLEKRIAWEEAHPDRPIHAEDGTQRIAIATDRWGTWNFALPGHRNELAVMLNDLIVDILICGPLATLGMIGGGTPDDVTAFEHHLYELRTLLNQPLALWLIHHENKAGDVSGAWERVPDTMLHVQARGNGQTHIVWRKVRNASELHGTSQTLTWTDGRGYQPADPTPTEAESTTQVRELFETANQWRSLKEVESQTGLPKQTAKRALLKLVETGFLTRQKGVPGKTASAYYWIRKLYDQGRDHVGDGPAVVPPGPEDHSGTGEEAGPPVPPRKGTGVVPTSVPAGAQTTTDPTTPTVSDPDIGTARYDDLLRRAERGEL